jgi:putative flavoprotein involved in K+ transport
MRALYRFLHAIEGGIMEAERIDTVIVGGGQAGLSVGYRLARQGRTFVILDANDRVGDAWRNRWDSLLLFTPAYLDGLAGMKFPAPPHTFPTKDQMADYLETYAQRFALPVLSGVRVDGLSRRNGRFVVTAGDRAFESDNVVVAMANYQRPRVPPFAAELDPRIVQLHSTGYKNPSQLRDGRVLIVGAGNSGADIAMEVARTHPTSLSGTESGHVPFRIERAVALLLLVRLVRFVGHRILTVRTPIGRKLRPTLLRQASPLIRVKPKDLTDAGVERVARVTGVRGGMPVLDDGSVLEVENVIWCTGHHPGFAWIDLPVFGEDGQPNHERGIVTQEPGLYFVGLNFLYSMTSDTITGVGRDAARIAKHIASRN